MISQRDRSRQVAAESAYNRARAARARIHAGVLGQVPPCVQSFDPR